VVPTPRAIDESVPMPGIAHLSIDAIRSDGEEFGLHIAFGAPFVSEHGWACTVTLHPLFAPFDIFGADSLQALTLALRTTRSLLEDFTDKGGRLTIDGEAFPLDAWFGPPSFSSDKVR